jgi:hypothetical protein
LPSGSKVAVCPNPRATDIVPVSTKDAAWALWEIEENNINCPKTMAIRMVSVFTHVRRSITNASSLAPRNAHNPACLGTSAGGHFHPPRVLLTCLAHWSRFFPAAVMAGINCRSEWNTPASSLMAPLPAEAEQRRSNNSIVQAPVKMLRDVIIGYSCGIVLRPRQGDQTVPQPRRGLCGWRHLLVPLSRRTARTRHRLLGFGPRDTFPSSGSAPRCGSGRPVSHKGGAGAFSRRCG